MNGESDRERGSRLPASPVAGRPPLLPFHKRPKGQKWAGTRQHRGISLLPTAQPASSSPWAPYPRSSGGEGEGHDSGGQTWCPFTLEAPVGEVVHCPPTPSKATNYLEVRTGAGMWRVGPPTSLKPGRGVSACPPTSSSKGSGAARTAAASTHKAHWSRCW